MTTMTIQSFIEYLEERIIKHELKRCKCKNENDTIITIYDDRLKDPLIEMINDFLSIGERFPLLFVSKYFNQLISDTDKQEIKKHFITKFTTPNLINWYRSIYPNSHKKVINKDSFISYGNLELLYICLDKAYIDLYVYNYELFEYYIKNGVFGKISLPRFSLADLKLAVKNGNFENIKWLLENGHWDQPDLNEIRKMENLFLKKKEKILIL